MKLPRTACEKLLAAAASGAQELNATQLAVASFPAVRLPPRRAVRVRPIREPEEGGISLCQTREGGTRTAIRISAATEA